MAEPQGYVIRTDVKFGALEKIDVPAFRREISDPWFNQTLVKVNDSVVRLGQVKGEFHWHKHDNEDEFFFVLEGRLLIDVEGRDTIELLAHQGYLVPRGVVHRTRAMEKTAMLMMAAAGVKPTGD